MPTGGRVRLTGATGGAEGVRGRGEQNEARKTAHSGFVTDRRGLPASPAINRDTFAADLINALLLRPVYRKPEPIVECEECGRIGSDGFVWYQGEIMLCADEKACNQRSAEKRRT